MTSTCFPHRYPIFIWHQWFFTWISCFYMTSMVFLIDIVFDMTSMVLSKDIVFFYDISLFLKFVSNFYMTSMVFPIDIALLYDINGFSHRYLLRHQWFCPYILYFYMTSTCFSHIYRIFIWHQWFFPQISNKTSMVFHRDIVILYDINGLAHRYRISIGHQWFFPWISCFYMTSMVFLIDIVFDMTSMVLSKDIVLWHLLIFQICIEFLYDINGFSHRYRIFIWHQCIFP